MGLLDILTGRNESTGRVPPLARGIAELLAYGQNRQKGAPGAAADAGPGITEQLEDFFKPPPGGGPTAKGVVGALLTGGMMDLVAQFRGAGKAATVDSWVAPGANQPVSADDLSKTLSEDQIAFLMKRTGLSRAELLAGLSERLPQVVDQLTPDGRLPTREELERRL